MDFLSFDGERTFDHVYALNVIHHIRDFFSIHPQGN